MTTPEHVVLGGNGVVGRETVRALLARGETPASVGRHPSAAPGTVPVRADLLVRADVENALRGARVAYLTAGLPYSSRVWAQQWPVIVRNAIEAASAHDVHLVYLDNVYAYGAVSGPMTETTPINPASTKGQVRAAALSMIDDARRDGATVTIGRSADFYGPGATTSVFNTFALNRVAAGRSGTWLFDADQPHSLTYTPDIGDALALLGTAPQAQGRTWHLPTAPALTGRDYVHLAAGPDARVAVMGSMTLRIGAFFNPAARETLEMAYQYTQPYELDSGAFEAVFGIAPTPVADGIAASLHSARAVTR